MTDTLETLLAKQAITETLYRYCYAMDWRSRARRPRLASGGMAHYGETIFEGTAEGCLQQVFGQHRQTRAPRTSSRTS